MGEGVKGCCDYPVVVIMPRAGEGRSIKIDPDVYEALLALKHGKMTMSDVIARMLKDCYGWPSEFPDDQRELEDFTHQLALRPLAAVEERNAFFTALVVDIYGRMVSIMRRNAGCCAQERNLYLGHMQSIISDNSRWI
jgi:hypothetical protein